eukprot:Em0062g8a
MNRKELEKIPQASQSQNVKTCPDTTPKSEDSSEPSREGATTESTPYIFNQFSSALHWIMATNYAADLIYYLDDFLLAGPPGQPTCSESTETMLRVCERLGIPVALDKLEGPATTITFLGITIDTTLQQLRLPPDKLQEMTLLIKSWLIFLIRALRSTALYISQLAVCTSWVYIEFCAFTVRGKCPVYMSF